MGRDEAARAVQGRMGQDCTGRGRRELFGTGQVRTGTGQDGAGQDSMGIGRGINIMTGQDQKHV